MSNVLKAFLNIVKSYQRNIDNFNSGNNRANNMGEGLENYIKDAFASTLDEKSLAAKLEAYQRVFSYSGNKNNPPDIILKNSDAIEIKKLESPNTAIALNSSYPKSKLYSDSPMLTNACKSCEEWSEKDMVYVVGNITKGTQKLHTLWMVYGDCFCADKETYERIRNTISEGIKTIPEVEFTDTKELGKVKKVDPLGITDLRIRGMWHIDNPMKIFNYIYKYDSSKSFQLVCLMKKEKYESLPLEDRKAVESLDKQNVYIAEVKIKNPNNPVQLVDSKLLVFKT